ncbi:MAG: PAS domain S-box protein, partial [Betaproteobacteria bacterium]|nr:PAS domain S-box protein [Betaproteobacteria bacterium]
MPDYTSMTRAELISLMRELEAIQSRGSDPAGAQPGKFPIFGERQRREFDAGPCPMRIFDRETLRYVAVNEAACRLYGYSRDEFLSLTVKDTRHREEHDDLFATLSEPTWYLRHWGPRRHVKKSGEVFIAEIVTQDILFNGGEARLSLTIDVTERSRVQELLRKREREFEALVENAPDIIMRFDRQLRHLYVNRAGSAATGIGSRGFIGKTGRELGMTPDLVRLWEQSLGEVFESKGERTIEFGCRKPEGLRHYESRIVPETGLDGRVETALVISRDITARKRAEVALRESSEFL